jgi:hypothetical protein
MSPGRDLNPEPPEYESGILTARPRNLVHVHRRSAGCAARGRPSVYQRSRGRARRHTANCGRRVCNLIDDNFHGRSRRTAFTRCKTYRFIFVGALDGKYLPGTVHRTTGRYNLPACCHGYSLQLFVAECICE